MHKKALLLFKNCKNRLALRKNRPASIPLTLKVRGGGGGGGEGAWALGFSHMVQI